MGENREHTFAYSLKGLHILYGNIPIKYVTDFFYCKCVGFNHDVFH